MEKGKRDEMSSGWLTCNDSGVGPGSQCGGLRAARGGVVFFSMKYPWIFQGCQEQEEEEEEEMNEVSGLGIPRFQGWFLQVLVIST